jgi:hypothetical protein
MAGMAVVLCLLTFVLYKELSCSASTWHSARTGPADAFPRRPAAGDDRWSRGDWAASGGVVLISAMLIIPARSARFWTEKLHRMIPWPLFWAA